MLVDALVAIVVLEVGLLGLVAALALVSRVVSTGHQVELAAIAAEAQLEALHRSGCGSNGASVVYAGSTPVDSLTWQSLERGQGDRELVLQSRYLVAPGRWGTDTFDTEFRCAG